MTPDQIKIPKLVHLFCNIIMTGNTMHTASKKTMVPELTFLSEHAPQLSFTDSKVVATTLCFHRCTELKTNTLSEAPL